MELDSDAFMQLPRAERLQHIHDLQSLQPSDVVVFDAGVPACAKCELLGGSTKIPWFPPVRGDLRKQ